MIIRNRPHGTPKGWLEHRQGMEPRRGGIPANGDGEKQPRRGDRTLSVAPSALIPYTECPLQGFHPFGAPCPACALIAPSGLSLG